MGLFVIGLNHKECPVSVREQIHFSAHLTEKALQLSKEQPDLSEFLLLSTCNRVEFYGSTEESGRARGLILNLIEQVHGINRQEFENYLYVHESKDAVRHLFRVASGLDSLVVGENEILGQLRDAFKAANQAGTVHSLLYRLMEKALKTGKEVHSQTKITQGAVSIPSVAVELAEKIFGTLSSEKVMVLGTGEMSVLTLKNLRAAGADISFIASRNEERGLALAKEYGAVRLSMEEWQRELTGVDILIASTAAPHPIVLKTHMAGVMTARRGRPVFLIDIAVPRNIEQEVNQIDDVFLYNVDDLKGVSAANLKLRRGEIRAAEGIIDGAVIQFQSWVEQLAARPTVERFEEFLEQIMQTELTEIARETGLDENRKAQLINRIKAKIMHRPFEKIKEASKNGGVKKHLEALHSLFNLDKE